MEYDKTLMVDNPPVFFSPVDYPPVLFSLVDIPQFLGRDLLLRLKDSKIQLKCTISKIPFGNARYQKSHLEQILQTSNFLPKISEKTSFFLKFDLCFSFLLELLPANLIVIPKK